jgi:hypothetical protein
MVSTQKAGSQQWQSKRRRKANAGLQAQGEHGGAATEGSKQGHFEVHARLGSPLQRSLPRNLQLLPAAAAAAVAAVATAAAAASAAAAGGGSLLLVHPIVPPVPVPLSLPEAAACSTAAVPAACEQQGLCGE